MVNIQGDEPLIDPAAIDAAVLAMLEDPDVPMGTLKKQIENPAELTNPNVVKVVTDRSNNAIYFSRSMIPYVRGGGGEPAVHYKHIGLYVYRRETLLGLASLPPTPRRFTWPRTTRKASCTSSWTSTRDGMRRALITWHARFPSTI